MNHRETETASTLARAISRTRGSWRERLLVAFLCAFGVGAPAGATDRSPSSFVAENFRGAVALEWTTNSELGTVGFYLKRWDARASRYVEVNTRIIPALISSPQGGTYRFIDVDAAPGRSLLYLLDEIVASGRRITHGPFSVDTRATASQAPSADLGNDASLARHGQSRSAHREWAHARRARAEAQDRDWKRVLQKRKERKEQSTKIGVDESGIYYVSLPWKQTLGLSNRGSEVAVLPSTDSAGFYFYGVETASNVEPDNVYRLTSRRSVQMGSRRNPARAPRPTGSEVFTRTLHVEEDRIEANNVSSDPDGDFWVWDYAFAGYQAVNLPFRTDGLAGTGPAAVTVRLKGGVEAPGYPDHHARILLNGSVLGDVSFDGLNSAEATLHFDSGLLVDGANQLTVEGLTDTGAPYSLFYVDSFDVTFESRYRVSGNRGEFGAAGNRSMFISGFTREDISVFDITDPNRPVLVAAPVSRHVDGTYGAVVASSDPSARYYAVTPDALRSPSRVLPDTPSSLKSRNNHGEYLVITTEALMETAQTLADYRGDLRSQVVDIEDIYDEFNFGNASPYALRDFLTYARANWRSAPRYVVLAGDGTYDYKNVQGFGNNLIPTRMADTPLGLYQADSWFIARHLASEPEIALGRLPVTTNDELSEVIRKIIARETALGEAWLEKTLLLADNPDEAGDFVASLEGVASSLPVGTPLVRAYFTIDGVWGSRAKLINGINGGTGFVSYFGHGGFDQLAGESVLTSWDAALFTNAQQPAVMTAMTCLAGNSTLPGASGLGETLVRQPGGGLVAMWGPSGWSENHLAEPLANEFYRAAFAAGNVRLGDAVNASRQVYRESGRPAYMLSIYNLLGDPALRLR